ncbi:actin-binding, cofilin/tropomyosin type protein [Tanacetum coccineum]
MEAHCVNLELKYQNQALKEGQHGQFSKVKSNEAKIKHDIDVIEIINIELKHKVAKLLKKNETLKRHYKVLFDYIKTTRAKTIEHTTSLIAQNAEFKAQLQEKGFAIAALKNELRKLNRNSVNTKFAKSSILGKPFLQPHRNQSVVRQLTAFKSERPRISKPRFASQVDVNNDLSKPVTTHYLPKERDSAIVKPHHVIAFSESRNSSKNMQRFSSNDMVHNHYLKEAKKKTQERGRNSRPGVMPSAKSQSTANGGNQRVEFSRLFVLDGFQQERHSPLYFKEEGIEHQTSTPRTPEQNGVVERRNRTLVEAARTMLSASKLPLSFWAEAVATACYTQNRSIIISTHGKTAYHIINDRKPSIKHLHIFGCTCYITRDGENLDKMKEKGDPCVMVGYSTQSKGYRVYNKRTRLIVKSIHIKFDEIKEMMSDHNSSDLAPQRQEMSVENVSSGLVPQGQKASDYDNSDPVPPRQNVVPSAEKTDSSHQGLEFLFSPLLEEYYNPTHGLAEENNNDQAPNASFQEAEFINPFSTRVQEIGEEGIDFEESICTVVCLGSSWYLRCLRSSQVFSNLSDGRGKTGIFLMVHEWRGLCCFEQEGFVDIDHPEKSLPLRELCMFLKQAFKSPGPVLVKQYAIVPVIKPPTNSKVTLKEGVTDPGDKLGLVGCQRNKTALQCLQQRQSTIPEYQLDGMFTKALPEDRFKYLVRRIGMICLTSADLEVLTNKTA